MLPNDGDRTPLELVAELERALYPSIVENTVDNTACWDQYYKVEAVKSADGKASLAHPYQMGLPDGTQEELVKQLKDWGLDAVECYYPQYTPEQQAFYLHLTEKHGLHATGGSDFHGEKVKPEVGLAALELELNRMLDP